MVWGFLFASLTSKLQGGQNLQGRRSRYKLIVHTTLTTQRWRNSRVDVRVRNSLCSERVSNSKMQKLQGGRSRYKLFVVTTDKEKDVETPGWTFALQAPCVHNMYTF